MKNSLITALVACLLLASCPCFAGMGRQITKGATSQTTYIRIVDSADGTPETGVTATTTGLDLEYVRLGAAAVDLTESNLASASAAYSAGGIFHVGNGVYRVDIPDAAVATGVDQVSIQGTADGMVVLGVTHQLVELPLSNSATFITVLTAGSPDFETGVQTALTNQGYTVARAPNLDNADAAVSSRQPTIWSGPTATVDLSGTTISTGQAIGSVSGAVGSVTGAVGSVTGNVGGNVVGSVASVTGAVGSVTGNVGGNVVGSVASVATGGITSGSFAGDAITAAKLAPDVTTEIQSGLATASALATTQADTDDIQTRLPTALVGGKMDSTATATLDPEDIDAIATATAAAVGDSVADGVWDKSTGELITAGSIGKRLVDNVDIPISDATTDLSPVQAVVDAIQAKTDNLPIDPADASVIAALIGSPLVDLAADIASSRTSIETKVDGIEIAAAGILTDIDQDPVSTSQLFTAVRRAGGLVGDAEKSIGVGTANLYGVEFRNVAPANRQIITVDAWEIISGTAGGITFGTPGRDRTQAKCTMTGVTPGTYRIKCRVTFFGGAIDTCVITVKVTSL